MGRVRKAPLAHRVHAGRARRLVHIARANDLAALGQDIIDRVMEQKYQKRNSLLVASQAISWMANIQPQWTWLAGMYQSLTRVLYHTNNPLPALRLGTELDHHLTNFKLEDTDDFRRWAFYEHLGKNFWFVFANSPQTMDWIKSERGQLLVAHLRNIAIVCLEGSCSRAENQVRLVDMYERSTFPTSGLNWKSRGPSRSHATFNGNKIPGSKWRPESVITALLDAGAKPTNLALSWWRVENPAGTPGGQIISPAPGTAHLNPVNRPLPQQERLRHQKHDFDRACHELAQFNSCDTITFMCDPEDPQAFNEAHELRSLTGKAVRAWDGPRRDPVGVNNYLPSMNYVNLSRRSTDGPRTRSGRV